jgi:hypothetical protein
MAKLAGVRSAVDPNTFDQELIEGLDEVTRERVRLAKEYTNSRGTAGSGKAGRVETGKMVNAIAGETKKSAAGQVRSRVGFLRGREEYFALQTSTGFEEGGYRPDKWIEPTYALLDARLDTEQMVQQAGTNILRRLSAKIRKALR